MRRYRWDRGLPGFGATREAALVFVFHPGDPIEGLRYRWERLVRAGLREPLLIDRTARLWSRFAATGTPTASGVTHRPLYPPALRPKVLLSEEPVVSDAPARALHAIWNPQHSSDH